MYHYSMCVRQRSLAKMDSYSDLVMSIGGSLEAAMGGGLEVARGDGLRRLGVVA